MSDDILTAIIGAIVGAITLPLIAQLSDRFKQGWFVGLMGGVTKRGLDKYLSQRNITPSNAKKIHIESGKVEFGPLRGLDLVGESDDIEVNRLPYEYITVKYNGYIFSKPPKIIIGISELDTNNIFCNKKYGIPVNTRVRVHLEDPKYKEEDDETTREKNAIGLESFILKAETWHDSYVHKIKVNWIAYGEANTELEGRFPL